tara:strand:- start:169 stop:1023 length:855 start_codon:yes stop_codon:yes gene_type:complete
MKIIIFGGSGFLGVNLAKHLLNKKANVTIFDKKKANLKHKNLKKIIGNISDYKKVKKAVKGHDYVYNFAGISDIEESINKPFDTVNINILGTINTLEACIKNNIKKYLFASSIYVLSDQGGFYRTSKKASELYIEEYNKRFNQKFTIIRYGSIYGIAADKRNGISKILNIAKKNNRLEYGGTSKAMRKFIHILDACKATEDLMKKKFDNKIVCIMGKKSTKIKDLMKYLKKKLNIKKNIIYNNKPQLGHYDINPFNYKSTKTIFYYRKKNINFFKGLKEIIKQN